MSRRLALIALALALLATSPAVAQEEADPEAIEQAQQHFETGARLYQQGDYEGAIQEFERGYTQVPNPIFLYNISLAHTKLGNREEALSYAERAERVGLEEPDRSANAARMSALRRSQTAEQAAVDIAERPEPIPSTERTPFTYLGWTGVGMASVGLLAVLGTLQIDQSLAAEVESYRRAAQEGDQTQYDALRTRIKRQQTAGRILFFVGVPLALAGGGLIVYDVALRERGSSDVQVRTFIGSDGVGVGVSGTF